ncbi:hypothetical protein [Vibrio phage JSF13]|jgi:hypothetical protein|nr:hypothetical protein [Vibrio phage JSF13]ASV42413.1 hypothetical protein [Vibrio phage JSF14]ASV42629.1 hypothetical protein [Vibrio phage JSF17]AXY82128.1 hypothetical protein ICP12011A_033 [Vibrio phage ICP1_2011_A]AXY82347.1 hypothetical protein ICP12011B_030 [Vibrio phage ICP1_2011_B]QFR59093.1 hypothetical protein ICP12017FMathbaria_033 [Vibrio phage ICP1_2017_F_Mathbaria]QVV99249.1 hypothetical protein 2015DhaA_0155 [Vibrio phage ICP1]HAS3707825.1 hypothetical protein [Vibrio choler
MLTKTLLHTVVIEGGYKEDIPEGFRYVFESKGALSNYLSSWRRPNSITKEDWEVLSSDEHKQETLNKYPFYEDCKITVQDKELVKLLMVDQRKVNIKESFEVEVEVPTGADQAENYFLKTMQIMEKYQNQLERLSNNTFNTKCNLHTGGGALSEYNQLMLCEDICTDELQSKLQNGWRIIAVCVQPDQRRPDYILGKHVAEDLVKSSAERW